MPKALELLLVLRQPLLVLELGQAAAERQHAAAEVAVSGELAAEVLRRPALEQVAAAGTLQHTRRAHTSLINYSTSLSTTLSKGKNWLFNSILIYISVYKRLG